MSITKESDLVGMQQASNAVAYTLKEMKNYARPGMSTKELDEYGVKYCLILELSLMLI